MWVDVSHVKKSKIFEWTMLVWVCSRVDAEGVGAVDVDSATEVTPENAEVK